MYVWYPTSDVNIERNIFTNSGGISVGTSDCVKVNIINNVFYKQTTNYAVENWASYGSSETIVQYNSFLSNDRIALRLPSGYDNAKMKAINNYWNTDDILVIDNMIFDKNDDLGSSGPVNEYMPRSTFSTQNQSVSSNYITYEPFLTEKEKNTPEFSILNPILSYVKFEYSNKRVMVDKAITIKFNEDIFKGNEFDKITLLDSNNNLVPINVSIDKNNVVIVPKEYINYSKDYYIYIDKASVVNIGGNGLCASYKTTFTTEEPRIDINNDSIVDIIDIANLAINYNCNYGDNGWNALYDFNGDKKIDIFDIVNVSNKIMQ